MNDFGETSTSIFTLPQIISEKEEAPSSKDKVHKFMHGSVSTLEQIMKKRKE